MTLREYIEQVIQSANLDIKSVDKAIEYCTNKAREMAHGAQSIGIDDETISDWLINGVDEINNIAERKAKPVTKQVQTAVVEDEPEEDDDEEEEVKPVKPAPKPKKAKEEKKPDYEEITFDLW